ncbi:MAG: TnpV protein [Clostridia bacterium]|nr:TnpV protein [Clostridia bacterium]
MRKLPKEMTENGIHYTLHGAYYLPDLTLPEAPKQSIGRYGRMRRAYLEEHRPGLYERLILSGRLYDHLLEIDQTCRDRMERIVSRMAEVEGVDEGLKASDQLGWVGRMNSIRASAEETVLAELVYG